MPIFDPTLVQYFIQLPTYFFFARYQHMINDNLSKKNHEMKGVLSIFPLEMATDLWEESLRSLPLACQE